MAIHFRFVLSVAVMLCSETFLQQNIVCASTKESLSNPTFEMEMQAVENSSGRSSAIEHIRAAISLRPGNIENISLEFRIGNLLLGDDLLQNQSADPDQALKAFERIVEQYDHKAFYQSEPTGKSDSPEFLVPQSCIMAASILDGVKEDHEMARKYLRMAMDDICWTFATRRKEWAESPKPVDNGLFDPSSFERRVALWKHHHDAAAAGNIMGGLEIAVVEAAVREFGFSYGPQPPENIGGIMGKIVADYPDSPLAKAAKVHIERAAQIQARGSGVAPVKSRTIETPIQESGTKDAIVATTPQGGGEIAKFGPSRSSNLVVVIFSSVAVAVIGIIAIWLNRRRKYGAR